MIARPLLVLLSASLIGGALEAAPIESAPPIHRVALLVGANHAAPGRAPLRYSYDDAQSLAAVLTELGGFASADVITLRDPAPAEVLEALDRQLAALRGEKGETLLLFYYSGHADEQALYPDGKPLEYSALRQRLDGDGATVRIGILDACSGGGWTRSKGMQAEEPFAIAPPLALASEGSVLLASSSGVEKARESARVGGSFFTHHFVAGLRGAADARGDGRITINEAFAYARERTIRDSALSGELPQHPSFAMNLRGRAELPLTFLAASPSTLLLAQEQGPLEVIELQSGLLVLEAEPGPRSLRLAVPPGKYLVRRRGANASETFVREVQVDAGATTSVAEQSLTLVARGGATKDTAGKEDETPASWPDPRATTGYVYLGLQGSVAVILHDAAQVDGGAFYGSSSPATAAMLGVSLTVEVQRVLATVIVQGGASGNFAFGRFSLSGDWLVTPDSNSFFAGAGFSAFSTVGLACTDGCSDPSLWGVGPMLEAGLLFGRDRRWGQLALVLDAVLPVAWKSNGWNPWFDFGVRLML